MLYLQLQFFILKNYLQKSSNCFLPIKPIEDFNFFLYTSFKSVVENGQTIIFPLSLLALIRNNTIDINQKHRKNNDR